MKPNNTHTSRESWLAAATHELRPYFAKLGHALPDKMRFAIAFTSTGKRGRMTGECWHPASSADQHFEIIIRADIADPVEVLAVLVHELIHTLLPLSAKHGKPFRDIAVRVGLEGKMRQTQPTQILTERLQAIANTLGPLPHAQLHFAGAADVPKKQGKKWLKAECGAACGYGVRITAKWARVGLPLCPIDARHGPLVCEEVGSGDATDDGAM
jgi:hypothetical protein